MAPGQKEYNDSGANLPHHTTWWGIRNKFACTCKSQPRRALHSHPLKSWEGFHAFLALTYILLKLQLLLGGSHSMSCTTPSSVITNEIN